MRIVALLTASILFYPITSSGDHPAPIKKRAWIAFQKGGKIISGASGPEAPVRMGRYTSGRKINPWTPKRYRFPTDDDGMPLPDSPYPHSQLGRSSGKIVKDMHRNTLYQDGSVRRIKSHPEARVWDYGENGKLQPQFDLHFTDHGYPALVDNYPHIHRWHPNDPEKAPEGGFTFGEEERIDIPDGKNNP